MTIGGGTGSFVLLSGLKKYQVDISAILSMADDGGSTGTLRDELGVLPPGDVRQCLVALSESSQTLRKLLDYRFESGGLEGHNFGNLLLSALEKISGSFDKGVEEAIKILNVKGEVIPVSDDDMRLQIELNNGALIKGEKELDKNAEIKEIGLKNISLQSKATVNKKAQKRIEEADMIVIGPGDYYGSILPNLLVDGVSEAIRKSKAIVVYNCNLTNKKGQTRGFDLDDYVDGINKMIGVERIDYVTFNIHNPTQEAVIRYEKQEGEGMLTLFNENKKKNRSYKVIRADLLRDAEIKTAKNDLIADTRSFIRHDSDKVAKVLIILSELGEYENLIKEII